jgi:hypothetical protein
MQPDASLNAGLFVGRKHVVVGSQCLAFPESLIEIEHPLGFWLKFRITGKDPTAMLPRANGILVEPSPNGPAANFGCDTALSDLTNQILPL